MAGKSFKEQMQRDLSVFLDLDVFGEAHEIEGKPTTICIDNDRLIEMRGGAQLGLYESFLLFFANAEDLPPRKPAGSVLNVDGREYTVDSWSVTEGMAQVILSQARTR